MNDRAHLKPSANFWRARVSGALDGWKLHAPPWMVFGQRTLLSLIQSGAESRTRSWLRAGALAGLWLASPADADPLRLRVATYNASLNRATASRLMSDLATPANAQARRVAEVVQRVAPDVLLLNEFDHDAEGVSLQRFHDNYLAVSQNGQPALEFPYRYAPPVNTGVHPHAELGTGYDFDNSGRIVTTPGSDAYGNDCFGFGHFPGQYGFAIYSRYPLDTAKIRTFQNFLWKDLPAPVWPDGWYDDAEKAIFRLSSKTHADVPIVVKPGQVFHLLASHPTPPSFDGAEDRNGRRNHDEIRFWAEYVNGASFFYDDATPPVTGGLAASARFVILGDLNADPFDGDSYQNAIRQLYEHPKISAAHHPASLGAVQRAQSEGGPNTSHQGDHAYDTADFGSPGNLRVDHVLPSRAGFTVADSGVFWPRTTDPGYGLLSASDHRLVWVDVIVEPPAQAVRELEATSAAGRLVLTWHAQAGVTYHVERSTELTSWTSHPTPVTLDPATLAATWTDDTAPAGTGYYRIAVTLEP